MIERANALSSVSMVPETAKERYMPGSNNEHDSASLPQRRAHDIASNFPGILDSDEQQQVAQRIERLLKAATDLRSYPLENADEPAPVFRPIGKEQP
jgi:hypothetical protein